MDEMAAIGATDNGGVDRLALTDGDREARDLLARWFESSSLAVRIDDFGNMVGRRDGLESISPLLIGSHLDTVRKGGRFDGALGVLAALEVVRTLIDHDVTTRRPIDVVNWTNEEGTRFQPSILGSGAVTGRFERDYVYSRQDENGVRFDDALRQIGYLGDAASRPTDGHAYLELHIEQGPVLLESDLAIGIVEGIVGDTWINVDIAGQAAHAGPSPMDRRRDALLAAAEIVIGVNRIALEEGSPSVGTVGRMHIEPNVINTIPGHVTLSVDFRNYSGDRLTAMVDRFRTVASEIAASHGVTIDVDRYWTIEPTPFADLVQDAIADACTSLDIEAERLWSGAGHDGKYAADRWPSGMIFVRSQDGISHVESELTTWEDVETAANVLLHSAMRLTS
jgi:N-carbamoyl-L-amino-acid hydrolase